MSDENTKLDQSGAVAAPRFFATPNLDSLKDHPVVGPRVNPNWRPKKRKKKRGKKKMRYAAYVRVSSEEQIGNYSVDAQKRAVETWVVSNGGILTQIYTDEGHSGRTAERPAFRQMRRDARRRKFDAIVVHKFDRFARNRTESLAIKSLLRHDYGIKIFSASEPSEDSDGPMGALIEGIMESIADWYSQNLSAETAKGKKERSHQGMHNNRAPFGMKKNDDKILVPNKDELPGLQMAYEHYATGRYSDMEIAELLNKEGYRSKTGRRFSKETLRDILQNRTYLGKTKYQKYKRRSDGSRSYEAPVEWFDGQHDAVLDEELFEQCQQVRSQRRSHRKSTMKYNPYLLRNLIYCYRCCSNPPDEATVPYYGKMRPKAMAKGRWRYYRCRARELGYSCEQKSVRVEPIDEQVVAILTNLKPPDDWREGITRAMGNILGEQNLEERIAEIEKIIKRMDSRWDHGFITSEDEYVQQRIRLQMELEQLTPVPTNELQQAADMLTNFRSHWERLEGDEESRHDLVKLIVERVYVEDDRVVAMTLRSNYHLVLNHNANEPTEFSIDSSLSAGGSDGTHFVKSQFRQVNRRQQRS